VIGALLLSAACRGPAAPVPPPQQQEPEPASPDAELLIEAGEASCLPASVAVEVRRPVASVTASPAVPRA